MPSPSITNRNNVPSVNNRGNQPPAIMTHQNSNDKLPMVQNLESLINEIKAQLHKNSTNLAKQGITNDLYDCMVSSMHLSRRTHAYTWLEFMHLNPIQGNNDITWLLHMISNKIDKLNCAKDIIQSITQKLKEFRTDNYAKTEYALQKYAATYIGFMAYFLNVLYSSKTPISHIPEILRKLPANYAEARISKGWTYRFDTISTQNIDSCKSTYNTFSTSALATIDYIYANFTNIANEYKRPSRLESEITTLLQVKTTEIKALI